MENHRKHNIFCHLYLNSNSNWYYFFYQEFSLKKPTYRMIYMYKREKLNYYHSIFKIYFIFILCHMLQASETDDFPIAFSDTHLKKSILIKYS